MLPFVYAPNGVVFLGLSPWPIAGAIGGWLGISLAERLARARHYDAGTFQEALAWIYLTGIVLGHVLDMVFYHPDLVVSHPASLLAITQSQSSFGGFTGAAVGGVMWKFFDVRRRGLVPHLVRRPQPLALQPVCDILMATFPSAWVFARLGCAIVHDHMGRRAPSGSWLAVAWPTGPDDGVVHALGPLRYVYGSSSRYDLGLLECLVTIPLALGLALTWRRSAPGVATVVVCLFYPPVRFALDFLRITDGPEADLRYAGLTFAQWCCIPMFATGVVVAARMWTSRVPAPDPSVPRR